VCVSRTEVGVLRRLCAAPRRITGLRAEYRALLHEEMATLDDREVETLAGAVEILDRLIGRLSQRDG
jgi:hypothetical protein